MNIKVRIENEKDFRRVEEITRIAFSYPGRVERGGIGCPYEHWMVNELRRRDGYTELSLVATVDEEIVGHIICSKAEVRCEDKISYYCRIVWYGLAVIGGAYFSQRTYIPVVAHIIGRYVCAHFFIGGE